MLTVEIVGGRHHFDIAVQGRPFEHVARFGRIEQDVAVGNFELLRIEKCQSSRIEGQPALS